MTEVSRLDFSISGGGRLDIFLLFTASNSAFMPTDPPR
jgi:hypothetical protein